MLGGSFFRQQVLERVRDRHHAVTPEIGLNLELLVAACRRIESREMRFQLAIFGLVAVSLLSGGLGLVFLLAAVGVVFVKKGVERYRLARGLRRNEFDEATQCKRFGVAATQAPSDDNVVVYKGFWPFRGAGAESGGWSFTVDLTRGVNSTEPQKFSIEELDRALEDSLLSIGYQGLVVGDGVFVPGTRLRGTPLLPDPEAKPVQFVRLEQARGVHDARRYKWLRIHSWQSELVVSYFLRASFSGKNLFFEAARYVLAPVATRYREIDELPYPTFRGNLRWVVQTAATAPFTVLSSLYWIYVKAQRSVDRMFGGVERATLREIRTDPQYDYGSESSIRELLAGDAFTNYFQRMDREMYVKVIEQQILDAIVDFLEKHQIDTSEIKARQTTILNHGIIVQKGDVKAGSLAVGRAAQAFGGILGRVGLARPEEGQAK